MNNLEKPNFSSLDQVLFLVLVLTYGALLTQLFMIGSGSNMAANYFSNSDPYYGRKTQIAAVSTAAKSITGTGTNSATSPSNQPKTNFFALKALSELRLVAPVLKPILYKPVALKQSIPPGGISGNSQIPAKQPIHNEAPNLTNALPFLNVPVMKKTASSSPNFKPATPTILAPQPKIDVLDLIQPQNTNTANAVVNILCSITEGRNIRQISSSGILISNTGLILTNAHVGIHPFIAEYGRGSMANNKTLSCKIRSGSVASASYALDFIYISPIWTARHPGETSGILRSDTGEGDFAILKAISPEDLKKTASVAKIKNLDSTNPFIIFAADADRQSLFSGNLSIGQSVKAIAYPIMSNNSANLRKEEGLLSITDLFGFSNGDQELIETSASTIGKSGASGGALSDSEGYLIGILANVITTEDPNRAKIRAISLDHINAYLKSQAGMTLESLIKSDGSNLRQTFESKYLGQVRGHLLPF